MATEAQVFGASSDQLARNVAGVFLGVVPTDGTGDWANVNGQVNEIDEVLN